MRILAWGLTDVGQKRDHNEDSFLICDDLRLFAVADGMGGHQGGDPPARFVEFQDEPVACYAWSQSFSEFRHGVPDIFLIAQAPRNFDPFGPECRGRLVVA